MADSAACRILIVSSTVAQAQHFVQRVKSLSSSSGSTTTTHNTLDLTNATDDASSSIPWTIVNKYYTADVHFETCEYKAFAGHQASEVPAVIYVWSRGDPYKEHVPALAEKLHGHDPEVSLAVRLESATNASHNEQDEEDGLDAFLSSHGFEYVDGDRAGRTPTRDGENFPDEDSDGVPGLPRVVDALSTIMWPSLVQSAATATRRSRARELLDLARTEEAEDGLRALLASSEHEHDATSCSSSSSSAEPKKSRMAREMDELERWLEEDDVERAKMDDAEAWGARPSADEGSSSDVPTPLVNTPGADASSGFEDDFAEFVGAPEEVSYDERPPTQSGPSYRSGYNYGYTGGTMFGVPHSELPPPSEIEETAKRLFAPVPDTTGEAHADAPYIPLDEDGNSFSTNFGNDEEDLGFRSFDLSRVLGALQAMKEEISGMEDEDERRKAAARIALGLVHGLRMEEERIEREMGGF